MTKKHYKAIAAEFEHIHPHNWLGEPPTAIQIWRGLREYIADILAQENPKFDRQRFYDATGFDTDWR